ncbi:MAG: CPBP family intramembrane metalloprotease [Aquisalinus sp.]|nr:CPBP family intramembrane metalloprotease [Aquisalinus sp.]
MSCVETAVRQQAWRTITIFLVLTLTLTSVFGGLMGYQGATPAILITGVMWSPGLAAIFTCLILKRPISGLPWRWGKWGWHWFAWALPIVYGLAIYLPVWLFGLGGSAFGNAETLSNWSQQLLGLDNPTLLGSIVFVVMLGTIGMVAAAARALGEEIGWRGLLIWELRKVMPFWAVGLLSGAIWAVWHWPAILFTDYNAGEGNFLLQMLIFTMAILPQGIVYAFITFRSNSLWPAVILHASHNLFIQRIYTPLTIKGPESHVFIDEFGIVMPTLGSFMALGFYFWACRSGLTGKQADS